MIDPQYLLKFLSKNKIEFFSGVPDSVLKNFTSNLKKKHLIASNEGSAVSIGAGYYLSTNKMCCIYMQNSGLGNAINPLISILHQKVYGIPLLLLIGWRGSPNTKDEPQHNVMGKVTKKFLDLLNIKHINLENHKDFVKLNKLIQFSRKKKVPVACLVERNIFLKKNVIKFKKNIKYLLRNLFIEYLLNNISNKTKIIATTGYTSRELEQIRKEKKLKKGKDFYMVGGMGHAMSLSLGSSISSKDQIICLDGDGSLLMHMGSMATIGTFARDNFKHILLNNNAHESVGGQSTFAKNINFKNLAISLGYKSFFKIDNAHNLNYKIKKFLTLKGPSFLEVKIEQGTIKNLTRPKDLKKIKENFINF